MEEEVKDGTLVGIDVRPPLPRVVLRGLIAPGAVDSPLVDDLIGSLRGLALGG